MSNKVTASMVKELRDRTGVGMAKCKKALDDADGDLEQAIHILRKAGMASAVKKESRETNEGQVGVCETSDKIALVEVNVETDFVLQNDKFKDFLSGVCKDAVSFGKDSLEEFLKQKSSQNSALSIDELRMELVHSLGENIQIKRLLVLPKKENHSYGVYSHMGGKIVTLVVLDGSSTQEKLAKDIAMHVAAEAPDYLTSEDVPADVKAAEEEIAKAQVKGKPAEIVDKIVQGKLRAFYEQMCLTQQKYVKDPSMSVGKVVESAEKGLKLSQFVRWQMGN